MTLMNFKKIFYYIFYRLSRSAPTSGMRLHFFKKIPYVQVGEACYLGPDITLTPFGGGNADLENISKKNCFF